MFRRSTIIAVLLAAVGGAVVMRVTTQVNANPFRPTELTEQFFAQKDPMQRPGMGWLQELNLSNDQMQRIQTIRQQYRDRIRADREAARQAQQELRRLMASNLPSDRVRDQYRQTQAAREKAAATQFESMLAMREVLTVEQRQKLAEHMQKRGDRMRDKIQDGMRRDR